jgi:hypothetical protein
MISGLPTKTSTAMFNDVRKAIIIIAATPVKFPHLGELNTFMRDIRLKSFSKDGEKILLNEKRFYEILDEWDMENPWPSHDPKYKNKKLVYRTAKEKFIKTHTAPLEHHECKRYPFLVWTSAGGSMDVRCYKCSHLYPFEIEEGKKLRSMTRVPIGQCAEALTTNKLLTKEGQNTGGGTVKV